MASKTGSAVNLPQAIDQAIGMAAGRVQGKPVAVVAEYPAHLPMVEADRDQVVRVILDLVVIGFRILDQGEVVVRAELLAAGEVPRTYPDCVGDIQGLEQGGPWALVMVGWSGQPLSRSALAFLFGGEAAAGAEACPVDLRAALAEAARTVEGMGGRLWGESQQQEGSRFTFALPLRAARPAIADVSSVRRVVESHLAEGDTEAPLILVLVEDRNLVDPLGKDLSGAGYRVVVSTKGSSVLPLARSEHPALILLDLLARDPLALDIAMVLKQDRRTRNIPVLFLTSVLDPLAGVRMSAVNFLLRPVGTGALLSTISAVLKSGVSPAGRVLVVEPNDATRDTMIMMIQNQGYRVTEATGPEEALVLAERTGTELVLVNAQLAQDRDYWLLRELRNLPFDMSIFVLAEAMSEAEGRAAIRRGASGFSETGKLPDLLSRMRGNHGREANRQGPEDTSQRNQPPSTT